jgi:hypothetical protein
MVDITLSCRIPYGLDEELKQLRPQGSKTRRYLFFLNLGLKLFKHKTMFERNPQLIQKIVNEQTELIYKATISSDIEEFFKNMGDLQLDGMKMMLQYEKERREKRINKNYS